MEQCEEITPAPILGGSYENMYLLESKTYKLLANDNSPYELKMSSYNTQILILKMRQLDKISIINYEKRFDYEEITKILLLEKNYYTDIQKIFTFCDKALNDKKVTIYPELENHQIKVILKKKMDYDEIERQFYLTEKKNSKDDMIQILTDEMNNLKLQKSNSSNIISNNNINNNKLNDNSNILIKDLNEKINKLIENNELFEVRFNSITDENAELRKKIIEMEKTIKNLESKISDIEANNKINISESNSLNNSNNNVPQINLLTNFSPKLEFIDIITKNHSKSGWLRQFVVFKNKNDNHDYLVYANKSNHLDIYRIIDKQLIRYLKGHEAIVSVIKYFIKNNNYEYLLSCDENKVVICWSLQTFSQQFKINTNMKGYIWDATVLFNITINKFDFCIIPSNSDEECSRIYNFNSDNKLIGLIRSTLTNKTNYLIPWYYNNNYYLIECCNSKISINNILKDENYANLEKSPEGMHCCGYIYKDIFLCVTDYNNNFLRIWNLVSKSVAKEISFEGSLCYGITPWNDEFSVIATSEGLIVLDINKGILAKKITSKKINNLCGIQKVNSNNNGEYIVCSNQFGLIALFK